jgi:hypothetical protein
VAFKDIPRRDGFQEVTIAYKGAYPVIISQASEHSVWEKSGLVNLISGLHGNDPRNSGEVSSRFR